MASMCLRLAISGTTPPKREWKSICEATTSETMVPASSISAAAVSSHDDSMARISLPERGMRSPVSLPALAAAAFKRSSMPATSCSATGSGPS